MSFPPRHICVAAALAIAAGVGSIVEMIFSLVTGGIRLDLGFVGIPIGCGLLIGRSSSRKWALFFSGAGLFAMAVILGIHEYDRYKGGEGLAYPDNILVSSQMTAATAGCLYVLLALLNKRHREWFDEPKADTAPMKGITWAVVAVSFLLHTSMFALHWWVNETHRISYTVDVEIIPFNAEDGKGIMSLSAYQKKSSALKTPLKKLPNLDISHSATIKGMSLGITGVASSPTRVILSSRGFRDTTVTLDEDSRGEIRVPMEPVE